MTPTSHVRGTSLLQQVERAETRYEARAAARERTRDVLDSQGVLHADTPDRVGKRLARLGADWSQATALEQTPAETGTGRSLPGLSPDHFSASLLGLERLMGRNDLIDVGFLEAGHLASRPVGRVSVRDPGAHYGTGFLISPSLLLTNNHVLADRHEAGRGVIEFNYQAGIGGRPLEPVVFDLEPGRFFVTDQDLDFTVVAVAERSRGGAGLDGFSWLRLSEAQGQVILGEMVNIIQHPNGEPKQLALRENQLVDLLDDFVHYATDTAPGSSGSPVFNDQWDVVALHHAGVPLKDADGRYLSVDGTVWQPHHGEDRLAWKANEGVRISRVLQAVRQAPLSGAAAELRTSLFEATAPSITPPGGPQRLIDGGPGGTPTAATDAGFGAYPEPEPDSGTGSGTLRLTVPLHITVGVTARGQAPATPVTAAVDGGPGLRTRSAPPPSVNGHVSPAEADLRAALAGLEAGRARPYYEPEADRAARETYYAGLDGAQLGRQLTALLERTHERQPAYKPMRLLYPWVDLHPDEQLRSIYSGRTFAPEEFIRADAAMEAARIQRLQEMALRESALGPEAIEAEIDALEASLAFNCEHVVPQSWFSKREPMRGDLHHLFACETNCNSFRSNIPYFDFTADVEEVIRTDCGRREAQGFEPSAGKGAVARATLYFLLRYPGQVGDAARELRPERLDMLLTWHEAEPVGTYERHRNFAVAEIQGNRNPFIDHPEWGREIDFSHSW
ncbi:endonuclease [Streptomyces sp. NPDC006627]|uniref:endonuclease n=1 Tax=Streptomyces sp. NPDC006627 TaxID=3154679 RepID=UPI0033BBB965